MLVCMMVMRACATMLAPIGINRLLTYVNWGLGLITVSLIILAAISNLMGKALLYDRGSGVF